MPAPREIRYAGGQTLYNKEKVDALLEEAVAALNEAINEKQDQLTFDELPTPGSNNPVVSDGIYQAIAASASVPVGETMFWPVSECIEKTVVSDNPFEFDINGKHYSVEVPNETIKLLISKNVPANWHALDGSVELLAEEYPELAAFMPTNVTNDGKIWLPYVRQKIIKIR